MKRQLVIIEWLDSHSGNSWKKLSELEESTDPLHCVSVGWIIAKKNGTTMLAASISGERNGNVELFGTGYIAIPNSAIRKIKRLKA